MNCHVFPTKGRRAGFTLIELLVVIAIIGILMALLFPAVQNALESAKKTQAKNDIMQTITSIKSYYTEYSRYPELSSSTSGQDTVVDTEDLNGELYDILRYRGADKDTKNPRGIVYFEGKTTGKTKGGFNADGTLYDPWGVTSDSTGFYKFVIDGNYDNEVDVSDIGGKGAVSDTISTGVAGMSDGRKKGTTDVLRKDDVMSW